MAPEWTRKLIDGDDDVQERLRQGLVNVAREHLLELLKSHKAFTFLGMSYLPVYRPSDGSWTWIVADDR